MKEIDVAKLMEEKVFAYHKKEGTQKYHFIVVGAGGTGGYLIPNLARMVAIKNKEYRREGSSLHAITIVDQDLIESKNLLRQQFVEPDIGKNKAEVMAQRYGRSFGEPIAFVDKYIETTEDLLTIIERTNATPVVIDATDNNKTRLILIKAMEKYTEESGNEIISLSSGNESRTGQVVFSYLNKQSGNQLQSFDKFEAESPTLFDIFPNAEVDKLPTELSCAEQAISAPQNIHANLTAANLLFGFVNKLINYEAINELAIFFNTVNQLTSVYHATNSDVKELLTKVEKNNALYRYFPDGDYAFSIEEGLDIPNIEDFVIEEQEEDVTELV